MTTDDLTPAARGYLLALADDEHAIGARHANWIGMGPFLEEDLAFCSIAQDELGHALALYEHLVAPDEIDRFALLRDPDDYRSCALAESECSSWELALARHWLYDLAENLRWRALRSSSVPGIADLANQVEREESFHRSHADLIMRRVCDRPGARAHVEDAVRTLAPIASSVWSPADHESDALNEGVADRSALDMAGEWAELVIRDGREFGLAHDVLTLVEETQPGPDRHHRSADFDAFHRSLGEVISLDPAAVW